MILSFLYCIKHDYHYALKENDEKKKVQLIDHKLEY